MTEEEKLLATLSPPLIHAALEAMRWRADQGARPHAAHGLTFHLFTHTHRHSAFVYSARLLPPGTQQQRR